MKDTNEHTKENNLQELNGILFDNLRQLVDGNIDEKRATAVVNIANSIIGGAKTQLLAYKMTGGQTSIGAIGKNEDPAPALPPRQKPITYETIEKMGTYDLQIKVAQNMGFTSVAPAISKLGKSGFLKEVENYVSEISEQ